DNGAGFHCHRSCAPAFRSNPTTSSGGAGYAAHRGLTRMGRRGTGAGSRATPTGDASRAANGLSMKKMAGEQVIIRILARQPASCLYDQAPSVLLKKSTIICTSVPALGCSVG